MIAHGRTRQILARYLEVPPEGLEFTIGTNGKPRLPSGENHREIEFSLSHSGEFAVVAVTQGQAVGVDIEKRDDKVDCLALAQRFFSLSERDDIACEGQSTSLSRRFYSCWTRKEAYVKATGHGMSRGLDHFDVTVAPRPAALRADRLDPDAPNRWRIGDLVVPSGYSGAIAVEGPLDLVVAQDPGGTRSV